MLHAAVWSRLRSTLVSLVILVPLTLISCVSAEIELVPMRDGAKHE